ncbi:MAG: hypothetical protein H7281_19660 [Bacteriovorax sp.]|nr:hypothetical protein [Bacteriovorax sp.]
MKALHLFWSFVKTSNSEILENKQTYLSAFIALIILGNVETVFPLLGVTTESNVFIFLTIFATLATFVILSQIVLIQKKTHGGSGELKYFVPTFLLYNLYYSFLFFAGLLVFIVPGFYVLIFFSMVPFVAVLDDECEGSFFKASKLLVKKNVKLVAWASVINLLVEFSAFLVSPIQNPGLKAVANFLFSIPDAFVTLIMTVTTVKIYYYLMRL